MRPFAALTRAMIAARARRIGRREAEALLSRASGGPDRAQLVHLLDLAARPALREELAGREAAVAAFVRARSEVTAAPPRRRMRAWLSRALVVKAVAGLTVLLVGGVAVAAGTGQLPAGVQHGAHDLLNPLGVPVPDADSSAPAHPASPRPRTTPSPKNSAPGADPALPALCQVWEAGQKHARGKDLDPALVARLAAAAGGTDQIAAFCTAVLAPPAATPTPEAPATPEPTDKHPRPDHSKPRPSHTPHRLTA